MRRCKATVGKRVRLIQKHLFGFKGRLTGEVSNGKLAVELDAGFIEFVKPGNMVFE